MEQNNAISIWEIPLQNMFNENNPENAKHAIFQIFQLGQQWLRVWESLATFAYSHVATEHRSKLSSGTETIQNETRASNKINHMGFGSHGHVQEPGKLQAMLQSIIGYQDKLRDHPDRVQGCESVC